MGLKLVAKTFRPMLRPTPNRPVSPFVFPSPIVAGGHCRAAGGELAVAAVVTTRHLTERLRTE
uniref:Uncharacterized protein n=1 Tax=Leersia perrieri TaxID=77586 RepID=A0A0D9XXI0_9ORYZ